MARRAAGRDEVTEADALPSPAALSSPPAVPGSNARAARGPGRPRNADIDERLLGAAVELYLEHGLAGFNFDAVARRAKVGKPALYLRWQTREELLVAALEHGLNLEADLAFDFDTGSVREDLIQLAITNFNWCLSDAGSALLRLQVEQRFNENLRGIAWDRLVRRQARSSRQIVRRGIARGELPPGIDEYMVLEAVGGAVQVRVMDTQWSSRAKLLKVANVYAETIVDIVLGGLLLAYDWDPVRRAPRKGRSTR